jgi:hypothetical protein
VHSRKAILAFCRLAHRTVRCRFLSFCGEADRWRLGAVGAPDTVRYTPDSPVPSPDHWLGHVSRADRAADRWPGRPLAHWTVRCTPDSPVNYSRTPPIEFPRAASLQEPAWHTGHCPVHRDCADFGRTEPSHFQFNLSCFQHLDTIH